MAERVVALRPECAAAGQMHANANLALASNMPHGTHAQAGAKMNAVSNALMAFSKAALLTGDDGMGEAQGVYNALVRRCAADLRKLQATRDREV